MPLGKDEILRMLFEKFESLARPASVGLHILHQLDLGKGQNAEKYFGPLSHPCGRLRDWSSVWCLALRVGVNNYRYAIFLRKSAVGRALPFKCSRGRLRQAGRELDSCG